MKHNSLPAVTFPWPPRELSPNAREHWARKAKVSKKYRQLCFWTAKLAHVPKPEWDGDIHLHMAFCPPDNRRRDDDNMLASCKALRDGLADALHVDDNRFRLHSAILPSRKGGAVVVAISRGL